LINGLTQKDNFIRHKWSHRARGLRERERAVTETDRERVREKERKWLGELRYEATEERENT